MSLADEFLADLEENDNDELETLIENKTKEEPEEEKSEEHVFKIPAVPMEVDIKNISIRELAKLRDSDRLTNVSIFAEVEFKRYDVLKILFFSR